MKKKLVTAIVKKCPKKYTKPGKPWCVLKHPKDSETLYDPQPKGWPKHYESKKDAEYGVKMMKTFSNTNSQFILLESELEKKGRVDLAEKIREKN